VSEQSDHISKAARLLANRDPVPRETLIEACSEFWAALISPEQWPFDLLEEANDIIERILADGPIHISVKNMDPSTAELVGEKIVALATAAETFRSKGLWPVVPSEDG
jgi:hypothetical protein